jgi:hypothetical protein
MFVPSLSWQLNGFDQGNGSQTGRFRTDRAGGILGREAAAGCLPVACRLAPRIPAPCIKYRVSTKISQLKRDSACFENKSSIIMTCSGGACSHSLRIAVDGSVVGQDVPLESCVVESVWRANHMMVLEVLRRFAVIRHPRLPRPRPPLVPAPRDMSVSIFSNRRSFEETFWEIFALTNIPRSDIDTYALRFLTADSVRLTLARRR